LGRVSRGWRQLKWQIQISSPLVLRCLHRALTLAHASDDTTRVHRGVAQPTDQTTSDGAVGLEDWCQLPWFRLAFFGSSRPRSSSKRLSCHEGEAEHCHPGELHRVPEGPEDEWVEPTRAASANDSRADDHCEEVARGGDEGRTRWAATGNRTVSRHARFGFVEQPSTPT
jgi:hypothetical protein